MGGAAPLPFSLSLCVCLPDSTSHWRVASRETIALHPNTPASDAGESSAARVLKAGTFVCRSVLLVCPLSRFSFHHLLTRPSGSSSLSSLVPCVCERALIGGDDRGKQRSGDREGPHAARRLCQVRQGGAGQASAPAPLQVSQSVQFYWIQHWAAQKGEGNEPDICCGVCVPGMEMVFLWHCGVVGLVVGCHCWHYLACRLKLFM